MRFRLSDLGSVLMAWPPRGWREDTQSEPWVALGDKNWYPAWRGEELRKQRIPDNRSDAAVYVGSARREEAPGPLIRAQSAARRHCSGERERPHVWLAAPGKRRDSLSAARTRSH